MQLRIAADADADAAADACRMYVRSAELRLAAAVKQSSSEHEAANRWSARKHR